MTNRSRRSPRRTCSDRSGFTLLEVLLAVAILSVVATSLLVVRNNSIAQSADAYNLRVAANLGAMKIRQVTMAENLQAASGSGSYEDYEGFKWSVQVGDVPIPRGLSLQTDESVKQVKVTIQYPTASGEEELTYLALVPPQVQLVLEEIEPENVPEGVKDDLSKAGLSMPAAGSKTDKSAAPSAKSSPR